MEKMRKIYWEQGNYSSLRSLIIHIIQADVTSDDNQFVLTRGEMRKSLIAMIVVRNWKKVIIQIPLIQTPWVFSWGIIKMPKKMAMAQKYWKTMSSLCCPKKINFPPSAPRNGLARLFPGRYLTTDCKIQNLHRTNIPLLMLEIGNNGLREIFEKSNPSGRDGRGEARGTFHFETEFSSEQTGASTILLTDPLSEKGKMKILYSTISNMT